jgi:hypothetical protein
VFSGDDFYGDEVTSGLYGTREHEDWLIQMEAQDAPDERPDQPYTPCGCTSRAYGGDCRHTIVEEYE